MPCLLGGEEREKLPCGWTDGHCSLGCLFVLPHCARQGRGDAMVLFGETALVGAKPAWCYQRLEEVMGQSTSCKERWNLT